jgi:hypothetical protein
MVTTGPATGPRAAAAGGGVGGFPGLPGESEGDG